MCCGAGQLSILRSLGLMKTSFDAEAVGGVQLFYCFRTCAERSVPTLRRVGGEGGRGP